MEQEGADASTVEKIRVIQEQHTAALTEAQEHQAKAMKRLLLHMLITCLL